MHKNVYGINPMKGKMSEDEKENDPTCTSPEGEILVHTEGEEENSNEDDEAEIEDVRDGYGDNEGGYENGEDNCKDYEDE
jgi:hypothetical protein